MLKKFGKKKLLGLLTATAIVVTTVGSFAVWDTLSDSAEGTLSIATPITVTATPITNFTETRTYDAVPEYNTDVTFTVADVSAEDLNNVKLDLSCEIKDGANIVDSSKYDVTYEQAADSTFTGSTDTTVTNAANVYDVTIKPKQDATDIAGKDLTVAITGTLSKKTN